MFSAVVLAGERPGGSPLSRQLGLAASVLIDVAGKPAVQRALDALSGAEQVSGGVLCGPSADVFRDSPEFERILAGTSFRWLEPETGPSASAIKAIRELDQYPVLLTTGDHALLTPELVDSFCTLAREKGGDVVVGLVPYTVVHAAFPESRRTVQKYSDGAYCGSNLFAILSAEGVSALEFWKEVESLRKKPWKIAHKLGIRFLIRYLLRTNSLQDALDYLSGLCRCNASYVLLGSARAAVDVDSIADRDLAQKILEAEAGA